MKADCKISVLIPCYNAGKYLYEAVDSILNQTYRNLEIILIDDGSSDNTKEIIIDFASRDSRIVPVFNDLNLGLIRTLNKGVKLATGIFIARMDADDVSALNRIEVILNIFNANPELQVISAGYQFLTTKGYIVRRAYPKATLSKALRFVSFFCTPVNHPCVMVRAESFKDNPFDEKYIHSEDYELFSRLLSKGYKFLNLNEPLYYLRMNPESVSNKYEQLQISTHMRISVMNIDYYFGKEFDFFLHKVIVNRISFDVSFELLETSLKTLQSLRDDYIRIEQADAAEIAEIDDFLIEQKIDIYLQTLKYAKWVRKPMMLLLIATNFKIFLNKRGFRYFRLKFTRPFSGRLLVNGVPSKS